MHEQEFVNKQMDPSPVVKCTNVHSEGLPGKSAPTVGSDVYGDVHSDVYSDV